MRINLHQIKAILWKSYKIHRRHMCTFVFLALLLPTLLFSVIAAGNSMPIETVQGTTLPEENVFSKFPKSAAVKFLYSPKDAFFDELMKNVVQDLDVPNSEYIGLKNQEEVEMKRKFTQKNDSNSHILAAIFNNDNEANQFSYKMMYEQTSTEAQLAQMKGDTDKFITSGMITLQYALDKNYIELKAKKKLDTKFFIQKFPRPEGFDSKNKKDIMWMMLPTFTVFSFLGLLCLVNYIIEEKNSGIKELMKLMGLKSYVMWFGWFMYALVPALISIIIIVILVKSPFNKANGPFLMGSSLILFIHLLLYCIASITWMFALSSPFQHSILTLCITCICWLGSILALTSVTKEHQWNFTTFMLCIFFPNLTLFFGYELMRSYEAYGIAFGFGYLTSRNKLAGQEMTMIELWIMFLFEIVLYTILTFYIEAVLPGKYGIPKPWSFPCKKLSCRKTNRVEDESDSTDRSDKTNFEEVSTMLTPGIEINKLTKQFGPSKLAVAGITLNIYKDHITVLLGHNGAGKSVTMYMLTGMYAPTSGHIKINGYDIQHDLSKIRESLGLCPQFDMLHKDLTVKEHMMFSAMVKGLKKEEALVETDKLLADLGLSSHQKNLPKALSGGMKRRLCLGISLCGKPNVLILDEPTSGLDPEHRREVWDLLLSMRGQRTILITTHDMEEADVLGDYIAIMDHGHIKCYGTPLFLKDIFGTGYHLEIVKDGPNRDDNITQLVRRVVPGATVRSQLQTLIVYNLPPAEKTKFPALFTLLEDNKKTVGITHIGVSFTTMEEVFLRVGKNEDEERKEPSPRTSSNFSESSDTELEGSSPTWQNQFIIMLLKTIWFTCRNYRRVILLALLPIVVMIIFLLYQKVMQGENKTMDHRLDMFGVTKVLYKNDAESSSLAKYYENIIRQTGSSVERVSTSIIEALLSVGKENYQYPHHVVAADLQAPDDSLIALYSGNSEISVSVSVNLITSALLKDSTSSDEYDIEVKSQPFKGSKDDGFEEGDYWASVYEPHTLWMCNFIVLPLAERVSMIKHLQIMTGIAPITYWLAMYVWDSLLNLVVTILLILIAAVADYGHMYSGSEELFVVFCIFTAYGLSAIPLSYLFSYVSNRLPVCFLILLACAIIAVPLLEAIFPLLVTFSSESTVNIIKWILSIIPYYAMKRAWEVFTNSVNANSECRKMTKGFREMLCAKYSEHKCCDTFSVNESVYALRRADMSSGSDEDGIDRGGELICTNIACTDDMCTESRSSYIQLTGEDNKLFLLLMIMVLSTFLYFGLLLIIDLGFVQRMVARTMPLKKETSSNGTTDSDVLQEEQKVAKALQEEDSDEEPEKVLLVWRLRKNYTFNKTAVESVSFTVQPGECFGLLGVNGAGKTTTIKMLTGSVAVTQGDAVIYKWHLSKERSQFLSQIGYCPQSDALISCFTPWDHFTLFARLRGLTKSEAEMESEKWIQKLGIQEYRDKKTVILSGGNKRKVCTGVAVIGNPFLSILDEPSSAVDPVSRRNLWNVLKNAQSEGSCLVLTSHSMDECEAMCDRLAIMVNGRFQCLGNIQNLKQKFAQGYTVKVKLNMEEYSEENVENLKRVFENLDSENTFVLKDEHKTLLQYYVNEPKIPLSKIFKMMEDLKAKYPVIQDYSISQTTLEEIFLAFAKKQYNDGSLP